MSERDELKPCPFCGGKADFERMGTSRQSCIVECESCGVRHESSDEYGRSGQSWNERQPTRAPQAVQGLADILAATMEDLAIWFANGDAPDFHAHAADFLAKYAAQQPSPKEPA